MSTRVHELAKELGLKSQDLLDRIQQWGLDIKPSIFAGLGQDQVDRIKGLMTGPAQPESAPVAQPPARSSPSPSETLPISPSAPVAKRPVTPPTTAEQAPPSPTKVAPPTPEPAPTPTAPAPVVPVPVAAQAPAAQVPAPNPAPPIAKGPAPVPPAPVVVAAAPAPAPRPGPHVGPGPAAAPAPAPAPPGPRPGGLSSPPRLGSGGGPLSRHTTNRGGPGGGGGGGGEREPGGPPAQAPQQPRPPAPGRNATQSARDGLRPNPATPPPLKPSDYISPAGVRSLPGSSNRPGGGSGPGPNDSGNRSGDGPRREALPGGASRRPLPQVAAPQNQNQAPVRRPDGGPRPGGPSGGADVKTQRPERRFTPEEMRRMMQSGQIGGVEPPPITGRGPAPTRPGGPAASPRFGAPPAPGQQMRGPSGPGNGPGPALRRPGMGGPGTLAPPPMVAPPLTDEEEEKKKAAGRLGTPADRAGRRAKRNERANERRIVSPQPASTLTGEAEEDSRSRRGSRKGHKVGRGQLAPVRKSHADIESPITLRSLSEAIGVRANELIRKMMNSMNQMVTINANLDDDAAQMLALEFGVELNVVHERTAEDDLLDSYETRDNDEESVGMAPRPPIITILGHVDHGKTSLLDKIRNAHVVDSESGGITQHIGAYQVVQDGNAITFVDTPGHEAFTAMRARGANVTDIVVLVVAADDGVMPQTQEAIAHAKAAGVPIVVALNKTDLPNINYNKIFGELSQQDLAPEEYGGDTPVVRTSALTGKGIPELLEMLGVVAELRCDLRADPTRPATGTCLESSISEGRGVVATVLVQDGTLKVGDAIVCGDGFGRVRAMFDDKGRSVAEAGPSMPVEVSGLDEVPTAGEKFAVIDDITRAREIVDIRRNRTRGVALGERQSITLENLYSKMAEQKIKNLNLILKADVQGSLEALLKELEKLENPEVPIRVLLKGVGGITESDILLADASQAIVIGFRVAPEDRAVTLADEKKIDIRRYDIIYQVTDEIKKAVEGMLVPEIKEVHLGRAVVRQTFKITKRGTVAGCFVTQGVIERASKARIIREGREIYKGAIEDLKRFKDDAKEVREGFECGIKIANFDDLKNDDVIEAYRVDIIRRTL